MEWEGRIHIDSRESLVEAKKEYLERLRESAFFGFVRRADVARGFYCEVRHAEVFVEAVEQGRVDSDRSDCYGTFGYRYGQGDGIVFSFMIPLGLPLPSDVEEELARAHEEGQSMSKGDYRILKRVKQRRFWSNLLRYGGK